MTLNNAVDIPLGKSIIARFTHVLFPPTKTRTVPLSTRAHIWRKNKTRKQSRHRKIAYRSSQPCKTKNRRRKTWSYPSSASCRTETVHTETRVSDSNIRWPSHHRTRAVIRQLPVGRRRLRRKWCLTTTTLFQLCKQYFTQSSALTQIYGDCGDHTPHRKCFMLFFTNPAEVLDYGPLRTITKFIEFLKKTLRAESLPQTKLPSYKQTHGKSGIANKATPGCLK